MKRIYEKYIASRAGRTLSKTQPLTKSQSFKI